MLNQNFPLCQLVRRILYKFTCFETALRELSGCGYTPLELSNSIQNVDDNCCISTRLSQAPLSFPLCYWLTNPFSRIAPRERSYCYVQLLRYNLGALEEEYRRMPNSLHATSNSPLNSDPPSTCMDLIWNGMLATNSLSCGQFAHFRQVPFCRIP